MIVVEDMICPRIYDLSYLEILASQCLLDHLVKLIETLSTSANHSLEQEAVNGAQMI